jgi:hypothetical protein
MGGLEALGIREASQKQIGFCDADSGNADLILPILILGPSICNILLSVMADGEDNDQKTVQ